MAGSVWRVRIGGITSAVRGRTVGPSRKFQTPTSVGWPGGAEGCTAGGAHGPRRGACVGAGANRSAPPGRFEEDSAPPKSGSGEDLPPGDELTRRILEAEPGSLRAVPAPSQAPRDPVAAGNSPRGTWGRWPTPGVAAGRRTCQISRTWQVRSGRQAGPAPAGAPSATYDVRSNPTASSARSATPGSSRIRMIARQPVAAAGPSAVMRRDEHSGVRERPTLLRAFPHGIVAPPPLSINRGVPRGRRTRSVRRFTPSPRSGLTRYQGTGFIMHLSARRVEG
jgi:hypothetical protein